MSLTGRCPPSRHPAQATKCHKLGASQERQLGPRMPAEVITSLVSTVDHGHKQLRFRRPRWETGPRFVVPVNRRHQRLDHFCKHAWPQSSFPRRTQFVTLYGLCRTSRSKASPCQRQLLSQGCHAARRSLRSVPSHIGFLAHGTSEMRYPRSPRGCLDGGPEIGKHKILPYLPTRSRLTSPRPFAEVCQSASCFRPRIHRLPPGHPRHPRSRPPLWPP